MKLTLAPVIFIYQSCQFLAPARDLAVFYHDITQVAGVLGREWVLFRSLHTGMIVRDEHRTKPRRTRVVIQMDVVSFRLHAVCPFSLLHNNTWYLQCRMRCLFQVVPQNKRGGSRIPASTACTGGATWLLRTLLLLVVRSSSYSTTSSSSY